MGLRHSVVDTEPELNALSVCRCAAEVVLGFNACMGCPKPRRVCRAHRDMHIANDARGTNCSDSSGSDTDRGDVNRSHGGSADEEDMKKCAAGMATAYT